MGPVVSGVVAEAVRVRFPKRALFLNQTLTFADKSANLTFGVIPDTRGSTTVSVRRFHMLETAALRTVSEQRQPESAGQADSKPA